MTKTVIVRTKVSNKHFVIEVLIRFSGRFLQEWCNSSLKIIRKLQVNYGHLILLAEGAGGSWRVVVPKVGHIRTTEEEEQLLIFQRCKESLLIYGIWITFKLD